MPLIVRCTHAFLQTTQKSATMHALGPSMFSERSVWQHDQLFESFLALNAKKQDTDNHSCVTSRRNPGPLGKSNRHCDMYTPRHSHSFTPRALNIQFGKEQALWWSPTTTKHQRGLQKTCSTCALLEDSRLCGSWFWWFLSDLLASLSSSKLMIVAWACCMDTSPGATGSSAKYSKLHQMSDTETTAYKDSFTTRARAINLLQHVRFNDYYKKYQMQPNLFRKCGFPLWAGLHFFQHTPNSSLFTLYPLQPFGKSADLKRAKQLPTTLLTSQ